MPKFDVNEWRRKLREYYNKKEIPEEPILGVWKIREQLLDMKHNPKAWQEFFKMIWKELPITPYSIAKNMLGETQIVLISGAPRSGKTWLSLWMLSEIWWDKLVYGGGSYELEEIYFITMKDFLMNFAEYPFYIYDEAQTDLDMRRYNSTLFRAFQNIMDSQAYLYSNIYIIHPAPFFQPQVYRHFSYALVSERKKNRPGFTTSYRLNFSYKRALAMKKRTLTINKIETFYAPPPPLPIIEAFEKIEPKKKEYLRKSVIEGVEEKLGLRKGTTADEFEEWINKINESGLFSE